jgi:UDP-3-O-[3-hydroxymyristoyl] glucosamine N-acyltransferase
MRIPLKEIAQLVEGRLIGDGDFEITGASTIWDAQPGDITLADNLRLAGKLEQSQASAALVPSGIETLANGSSKPAVAVKDVHASFARVVKLFRPPPAKRRVGVSPAARISTAARLAPDVEVHAGAVIDDGVSLGAGCVIYPGVHLMQGCRLAENVVIFSNAVLYENTRVGAGSIVHAGASIGAYGFGYQTIDGRHRLSAQLGYVEIGADVEIGANTTIDRGTYGPTVIGDGTKIDNMVQIAHNCRIGRHNLICSQVGIAGSCKTGDYVVLAGQVGVRDHVEIGDRVTVGAKAGIMNNLESNATYLGAPAIPERDEMLLIASFAKLPEMRKQVKLLARQVETLSALLPAAAKTA